jgi:uncharacterized protein YciU (UPF0263 family)
VLVRVRADQLELRVHGRDEIVEVTVPLETAAEILEDIASDDLQPADVVRALRRAGSTDLVRVENDHDHVRVWIW